MQLNMGLIWIGALLVVGGVLFTAAKALGRGRLSGARSTQTTPSAKASATFPSQGDLARTRAPCTRSTSADSGRDCVGAGDLIINAGATTSAGERIVSPDKGCGTVTNRFAHGVSARPP